jgi:hypothetical protein
VRHERWLAVGTADGRRSTVWKFIAQRADVYIHTRMFGDEAKVSLHGDGNYQWSGTDAWVLKVPGRKNADRHMKKWRLARPVGDAAQHVFRIRIPESELQGINGGEQLEKIRWLPTPPEGWTASLECYITPRSNDDPALTAPLPHHHLFSLPLRDGRWFVVLFQVLLLEEGRIERLRKHMRDETRAAGFAPEPSHRACCVFTEADDGDVKGLIEMCLV